MRFTILGPVRAWLGETELETGPPTQRALLALLLVHAGQPVALADIVDTLWGENPPRTAVNIVHRHVGTLRRLFDPDLSTRETGRLLLPSSGGYRMDVDPASLDLLMFRRLAERAYDKRDLTLFDTALSLWHGRIADGVQERVRAHPAFVAVEREYVAVALDAARIALELGQPDRFVPALKLVATANPLNEAVQARLVTALAAMGNQVEAMETYQRTRDLLADELGIDPGVELREAYARIQQRVRRKPAVPTQLPGDLPTFTGRRAELRVTETLYSGQAMTTLAIFGMPGVGKTTLAVHVAHELADRFPDGQLYVNLRGFDPVGAVSSSNAVRGFLETLGVAPNRMPADLDGQAALYRSLLAGKRVLVVLDDARDTEHVPTVGQPRRPLFRCAHTPGSLTIHLIDH
ncbi:BTAD domain-containing putative transcriptional regulator [Kibdelosporangium lantanae]|uniref:BTAD domain-containing putative transcriptional regulator n=1 Tax=Kibdelosporangium lantanae TaxID=1497396 RepID=A0ABW3M4D4_9PSEU